MGVLIVAGTVTLVTLLVQRAGGLTAGGGSRMALGLDQPAGTRIAGVASLDQALAIWVQRPDGTEAVLLVDPRRGRVTGEIRPGAAGVPAR
jgi:hypothetical protein